jgi:thiamine kinase-like enzyme
MLLDWEYAGMNDPFFDLGNLAVNNGLDEAASDRLLAAVFDEPATDRRRAALTLFRAMSDFREAMWGVAQGVLSELDFDYADYARKHFDRLRTQIANPELKELIEVAATS